MAEQSPSDREELARRLRANIRQRRRWSLPTFVITLLLVGVPLGLLSWWLWPHPELPRLVLIAFDQVELPNEAVPFRARLVPQDPNQPAPDLRGVEVVFEEAAREVNARSERNGEVAAPWQTHAGQGVVEFKASYADPGQRYSTEDRARLFVWKEDTRLLLVEVAALADAAPDAWRVGNIRDIPSQTAAKDALRAAREKSYQVVYVAAGAGSPMGARKMRGWVAMKSQEEHLFPDGPVLGRLVADRPPPARWAAVLAGLRHRFQGSVAGVAKDPRLAEVLRDAGVTAFMVGAPEVPPGVIRVPSWTDLAAQLPK